MKKILLFAAAAFIAMGASAQALNTGAQEWTGTAMSEGVQLAYVEGGKPAPFYFKPAGTYFSGYAQGGYSLINPLLIAPPFADLTFDDASTGATSIQWKYVNPEGEYNMFNPMLTSSDPSITLNYSYATRTLVEAPVLTATNEVGDSTTSNTTNTAAYLCVGGDAGINATTNTPYGLCNVSTRAGGLYYSSGYYATNTASSITNWSRIANCDSASVRGFGEFFEAPAAPLAVTGFATHIREIATITSSVRCTVYKATVNDNGALTGIERIATQTIAPSDFVAAGTSRYYLKFDQLVDAKTGQVVEGYTVDYPVLVTIVLTDENDATSQMGVYYNSLTVNENGHAYVILNQTNKETGVTTKGLITPANLNWTGNTYTRSLNVSMLGRFEYLLTEEDKTNEYIIEASDAGDVVTFNVVSSVPYLDELGKANWTIAEAPGNAEGAPALAPVNDWLDVAVEDVNETVEGETVYQNKSAITVTVSPNTTTVPREAEVKVSFLGAEYTIYVTQEGTATGVEDITVAEDDTNAPTYNVMGQRVGADAKGILIRGGKKILVK